MKDIAQATGLGLATISKYVNGGSVRPANRERLDRAVAELGYRRNESARALKTSRTRTVGVVIPELASRFCTAIVSGVEDILRRSGYAVIVCDCRTDERLERQSVDFLLSRDVDGILCLPVAEDGASLVPALRAGVPVVLFDRPVALPGCSVVRIDNRAAAAEAAVHLIARGHRRIGLLCGDRYYPHRERRAGFRAALASAGIPADPDLECASPASLDGGYAGMRRLLASSPDMTAVFTTHFGLTLGAYLALRDEGVRIPGDLSIVGFDNMDMVRVLSPRLTTVAQPMGDIASSAAERMLDALERGRTEPRTVVLQAELIQGESVADLR